MKKEDRINGDGLKITHIAFRPVKSKVRHNPHDFTKSKKGKVPRKYELHGGKAASVLLKLFINGNQRCHTTDAPSA